MSIFRKLDLLAPCNCTEFIYYLKDEILSFIANKIRNLPERHFIGSRGGSRTAATSKIEQSQIRLWYLLKGTLMQI